MRSKFSLFQHIILLIFFCVNVSAQKVGIRSSHAMACWFAAEKLNFGCTDDYKCQCQNNEFLGTVLNCLRERLVNEPDINEGFQYIQNACKYNSKFKYTFADLDNIYFNATQHLISESDADALNGTVDYLTSPVSFTEGTFQFHYRAAHVAKMQYVYGTRYGISLIGYWMGIFFFAAASNFILTLYPELLFKHNKTFTSVRKHLTLPAMFKGSHSRPLQLLPNLILTAPTRGQSIILLGYFALNIVFLSINYEIFTPNPLLDDPTHQRLKYLGHRTGILAFTQIPLVILFAGRNNILIQITGISYNTFQVYHRWVARTMMIHAFIHSVCFTWIAISSHQVIYKWKEVVNWRGGNIATYAGIFMLIFAMSSFRFRFYETFLMSHKLLYIIFIVGISRHCWDFGWMGWVYASIGVHGCERGLRLLKVLVSGSKNKAYAVMHLDDTFRLSVQYSKRWDMKPGQYCYIRFLNSRLFWQAHPFSVYKSPTQGDDTLNFAIKAKGGATKIIADYLNTQPNKTAVMPVFIEGPYGVHAPVENYEAIYLLAGGMGVTATYSYALHMRNSMHYGQKLTFIWIIQDTTPLDWFGEEILSLMNYPNIEVRIYITKEPLNAATSDSSSEISNGASNQIFDNSQDNGNDLESSISGYDSTHKQDQDGNIIVNTNLESIQEKGEFEDELIVYNAPAMSNYGINIQSNNSSRLNVYNHPNPSQLPLNVNASLHDLTMSKVSLPSERIRGNFDHILHSGRPNIKNEVSSFMINGKGAMALVSCGPPSFIDYIRMSVVANLNKTESRVDYFEEAFSW